MQRSSKEGEQTYGIIALQRKLRIIKNKNGFLKVYHSFDWDIAQNRIVVTCISVTKPNFSLQVLDNWENTFPDFTSLILRLFMTKVLVSLYLLKKWYILNINKNRIEQKLRCWFFQTVTLASRMRGVGGGGHSIMVAYSLKNEAQAVSLPIWSYQRL